MYDYKGDYWACHFSEKSLGRIKTLRSGVGWYDRGGERVSGRTRCQIRQFNEQPLIEKKIRKFVFLTIFLATFILSSLENKLTIA